MKSLALVLAATVLGTGCFVSTDSTDYGDVNIYWDFVRSAPAQTGGVLVYDDSDVGSPDGPCNESGVKTVEVTVPGRSAPVVVSCVYAGVEGVGVDAVAAGVRSFRIRGWRDAFLVYDTFVNLSVQANTMTNHYVDVAGVSAPLDLFAYLAWGAGPTDYPTCAAATPAGSSFPPNIGFEIRDVFGNLIDDGVAGCVGTLPALVFAGDLDLDNYEVRMRGTRVEDGALVLDSCSVALDHFVSQTGAGGFAPTLLTQPLPTCL